MPAFDLDRVRRALPALCTSIYLNAGTCGVVAEPIIERSLAAQRMFDTQGMLAQPQALAWQEEARARAGRLLRCQPEQMLLCGSAGEGLRILLGGMAWHPDDEVLISEQEHPALNTAWYTLSQRLGVRVRQFPIAHDGDPATTLASIAERVTKRTRLIASCHVSYRSGIRVPAREICALAQDRGMLSLIDATHTLGVLPIDVYDLGCDMLLADGHRWLCAPAGVAVGYVRRELSAQLDPVLAGAGASGFAPTRAHLLKRAAGAPRLEVGMANPARYVGLTAAIDYLEDMGWDAIHAQQQNVATYLKAQILYRGWPLHTPLAWDRASALCVFSLPGINDIETLYQHLGEAHKIIVQRIPLIKALRISTAYFTSREDIERLLQVLDAIVAGA